MKIVDAIARSKAHNEIVTLRPDGRDLESVIQALSEECEDHVEANGVHEFWGADVDGEEWRVHVLHCEITEGDE